MAHGSIEDGRPSSTFAKVVIKVDSAKYLPSFLFPQYIHYDKSIRK